MRLNARPLILATLLAALVAHAVLLLLGDADGAPFALQALAVWTLCAFLPGLLLVDATVGRGDAPPTPLERIAMSVGMGYAAWVVGLLLLSYLPGPLHAWHVFAVYDALIAVLLALVWRRAQTTGERAAVAPRKVDAHDLPGSSELPGRWVEGRHARNWLIAGLAAALLAGAFLRLGNIGYAEYHGDEARAVLRAAAVIQGYDDVPFLHKKGPAEILLPTAHFVLAGRLTEAAARLPFALAGLTALIAVYLLGRRMFGPLAGWSAAMLIAVDGYSVAFSRIVQYQSLVLLTSALVVLIGYRILKRPDAALGYLSLAATLLATGLMAHYEAAFALIPAAFLWVSALRRHADRRNELLRATGIAAALGAALTALFYAPFVLHPQFRATYTYLLQRRLGVGGAGDAGGAPYNNLIDFFTRTTTYNSTYYVLLLIALTAAALFIAYRRGLGRTWGSVTGALAVAGLVLSAWNASWLTVDGRDVTGLFFAAALIGVWLLPRMSAAERSLWLWFGVPLLLLIFLTAKPRTHVYVFVTPWLLLAGMTIERGWLALRKRISLSAATAAGAATATALVLLFGVYAAQLFVRTDVEVLRTWRTNWPAGYWTAWDTLDNRALFGFPLRNGWKVAGRLYVEGEIDGPYATNEVEFWAPAWYTRGEWRCEDRADWFFQIANPQPDPEGYETSLAAYLEKDFQPWGQVTVDGDPRLRIDRRSQQPLDMRTLALEDYAPAFDAAATADLPLGYPIVEPLIANTLRANLGDADSGGLIALEGYELQHDTPIRPGDTLALTLYWRALQPVDASYKVFNQSFYGDGVMVAQQDGFPVCGARGTWLWDPGELIVDRHLVTVRDDAPDGLYPLYTGLYLPETFERLDVLDAAGAVIGDTVHLTEIRVGEE